MPPKLRTRPRVRQRSAAATAAARPGTLRAEPRADRRHRDREPPPARHRPRGRLEAPPGLRRSTASAVLLAGTARRTPRPPAPAPRRRSIRARTLPCRAPYPKPPEAARGVRLRPPGRLPGVPTPRKPPDGHHGRVRVRETRAEASREGQSLRRGSVVERRPAYHGSRGQSGHVAVKLNCAAGARPTVSPYPCGFVSTCSGIPRGQRAPLSGTLSAPEKCSGRALRGSRDLSLSPRRTGRLSRINENNSLPRLQLPGGSPPDP